MTPLIPYFDGGHLSIGALDLKTPGIALVLGVAASIWLTLSQCRRERLDAAPLVDALPWFICGAVVGGHLFDVLVSAPMRIGTDPAIVFRLWDGQSLMGGAMAGAVAGFWKLRSGLMKVTAATPSLVGEELWRYADAFAFALPLGGMLARVGCFLVHDHPGRETSFWLGVHGICPSGDPAVACHDLGLYESLTLGVIFLVFLGLRSVPRAKWRYVLWLMLLYGCSRFALDWLRHPDAEPRYGLLTAGQIMSIALVLFGIGLKTHAPIQKPMSHSTYATVASGSRSRPT